MNDFSARPMIESALLAAVGVILVLLGFYVPVVGIIATLVAPLPAALAVTRHGLRWGVLSSVVTALSLMPFLGWITALSLWSVFGLSGIALGWALRRRYSPSLIIAVTGLAALAGIVAGLLEAYIISGITPVKLVEQIVEGFKTAMELNARILGENPAMDEMMKGFTDIPTIVRLLPGALIVAALFQAYVSFEVARWVLPRVGQPVDALPPFSRWMFPTFVANLWLGASLAGYIPFVRDSDVLMRAVETILTAGFLLLMVQAFSLASYYLLRAGFPRPLVGFFLFMLYSISATSTLGAFLALSGMIDILFDFRRLRAGQGAL